MKLATAAVMRKLDACAIHDYGIPGVVLMENAGKGTVDCIFKLYGNPAGKIITIIAGPGNNGGDGFVIARHLHQLGALPQLVLMVDPVKLTGDAAINWEIVKRLPIQAVTIKGDGDLSIAKRYFHQSQLLVDAIFGTGLKREVSGIYASIIGLINQLKNTVVAVDISSGLDSDTGQPLGDAVVADLTVTYGLAKPGHFIGLGKKLTGMLEVVDIGIPPEVVEKNDISLELLEKEQLGALVPERMPESHKGSYGHLLLLAGAQGKTGAAILATQGALRSGVGLVSLAVSQQLNAIYESCLFEAMTMPLASDYFFGTEDRPAIEMALQRKSAVVLGPGIGVEETTVSLVKGLYDTVDVPMVVDADGLNCLAKLGIERTLLPRVLTPHPGEMARLVSVTVDQVQENRQEVAAEFAKKYNVILVLKGAMTVIAAPGGAVSINPTGNPGLAAGGTGDVLGGVIGSLLAQGVSPWNAACLGVYVHGLAADNIVARRKSTMGFLASELAKELPCAFKDVSSVV